MNALAPLRQELYDIVAYWLDMGVDGFRVDMANSLVKGCKYDSDKDEDIAGLIWFWKEFFGYVRSRYPESFFISEWVYPKNAVGKCGFVEAFLKFQQETNAFIGENGYFTAPTGSHDEIRLATGKTEPESKTAFAFLLTAKQVPFLYYGDEIGMAHNFGVSRDGGFVRTGTRTPMQWDESKNRGFSRAVPECEPLLLSNACINEGILTLTGTGFALLKLK